MIVISKLSDLLQWRDSQTQNIGFVPTMGALHQGHVSLIQKSVSECNLTVLSIFVNPLQFSMGEDLKTYPRMLEADSKIAEENKVDVLFLPNESELYPDGLSKISKVLPRNEMANCLCGLSRPGHFEGVLTIVLKLFSCLRPYKAFFGEKDFQQLRLIESMVDDFNLNLQIVRCPTIRLQSGLAMSSRNKYLSQSEKEEAAQLQATLKAAQEAILKGETVESVLNKFKQSHFEYFEVRNSQTLELTNVLPLRLFIAAKIGSARLIDNLEVK